MTFLDRLNKLKEARHEKNADLARGAGIPYSTIDGLYKKGYENAKLSTIQKIADYYGVSLDYLAKGNDGGNTADISPAEMDLLQRFRALHRDSQAMITATVRTMIDFEARHPRQVPVGEDDEYFEELSHTLENNKAAQEAQPYDPADALA